MRTPLSLFSAAVVLCGLSVASAADMPWHHTAVSRSDQARPGPEGAAEAGPQKYLQIEVKYNDAALLRSLDKFRIVDAKGAEVGEYWGNDPKKGLIFESTSRWESLNGLYLDGFGHREPLFQQAVVATPPAIRPAEPVPARIVRPTVAVDPYVAVPQREVVVPQRDDVYVGSRVVGDRVVVDDRDIVVRGHDTVIDDGLHYVGGERVDVYDDGGYRDHVVVHHRGGDSGYGGGSGTGGSGGGRAKGGSGASSGGSADDGSSDDVTVDDPTAGKAIAAAVGINPDKAGGSGSGTGSGSGKDGTGSGSGKDGSGNGLGKDGSGSGSGKDSLGKDGTGSGSGSDGQGSGSGKDGSGKDGSGQDAKGSDGDDPSNGLAKADSAGKGDSQGKGDGSGKDGQGSGKDGQGSAESGQGSGKDGQGSGKDGQGSGKDAQGQDAASCPPQDSQAAADGSGQGDGKGSGGGSGDGPGSATAYGPAPGAGGGPGTGPGGGPGSYGPSGPGGPGGYGGPGVYGPYAYNPYGYRVPSGYRNPYGYYAPYQYNPYQYNPYQGNPGMPSGQQAHIEPVKAGKLPPPEPKLDKIPELVLYVTAGDLAGPGKVYQVKGTDGQVMGKVNLPTTATGIDMYRDHGVVLASPREGGKILQIDDTGKLSTIIEKDPALPHPVKISMPGNSDTMVVADDIADQLVMSTIAGTQPKVYQKFDQRYSSQRMSVAVANDKGVVFSSEAEPGVHKFMGDQAAKGDKPLLPVSGGVAADHSSLRWAAAQGLNTIKVYEGQQYMKSLRLPPNKKFYKNGLMSFGPDGSLCVAVQDDDNPDGDVWILAYHVDKEQVTNSFKWTHEEMQGIAVGTRMVWDRNRPTNNFKSTF